MVFSVSMPHLQSHPQSEKQGRTGRIRYCISCTVGAGGQFPRNGFFVGVVYGMSPVFLKKESVFFKKVGFQC